MIPAAGSVLFRDCTAAHIYPRNAEFPAEIAAALALPEDFMTSPRSLLLLPKAVELAYDRQAIVLAPALGRITVWPAFVGRLSSVELAEVAPYFGTHLQWPAMTAAEPHFPYMRLLAWACLAVLRAKPPKFAGMPTADAIEEEAKSPASPTATGNDGLARLCGGLD